MKKISCFVVDTAYPLNFRNEKIIESIKEYFPEASVKVITWDRNGVAPEVIENYYLYKGDVKLGERFKKFLYLSRFKKFVEDILDKESADLIIASHWDTLYALPRGINKKACVIYENLDIPDGSNIAIKIGKILERLSLNKADIITHASRFFEKLFVNAPQKQIILENKPKFDSIERKKIIGSPFVISFIGALRYFDTLAKLVDAVKEDKRFELHFYGNGPDFDLLSDYCKGIHNVVLYGKYEYSDIKRLYKASDLIWAVYPNKDYNVKYAISNKFYESMYLGVPCVYANETELGNYVESNRIGYTVNPYSVQDIKYLIEQVLHDQGYYNEVKENIYSFAQKDTTWDEDFKSLVEAIEETGKLNK